ncbi:DNA polymerase III subunit gamma and tau [Leucobacter sp. wl10]|nr:DNA polymerase III subunit gamma and tau [Leucobacter sp. wl10]RGE19390.1 DNA polymerase III subunit gamma and tau [Leucobacter sp. wl10]
MESVVAALYRRYRPETFAEMIGQSQVTDPLMTALRTERIGHAYLFSGPRGCGKTTSARILARCLNCAQGPTDTPCGSCPSCVELSRDGGGSLDVVEIDAASHGGVDDARDLRERAVFAPARDRFKIFIIDEAHMVTPGGFNALLKIVEEPPPHVKFVFATTEPDKVIGTIRSRTHHYPFRLIAPGTLIDYVQSLCESEGVRVEPGVLPLVVRAGGGSVRDTLSILDQLIAGSEGDLVTADRAAGLLGFTHAELLDDAVTALGAHDSAAAFRATDRVVQTGQDPRRFVEDLLERLRDLIVVSATTVDGAAAVFRGVPQDQLTRMFEQAQSFGAGELSRVADVVSGALDKMAGATAPRLQLELMVARALVQSGGEASRGRAQAAATPAVERGPAPPVERGPEDGAAAAGRAPVPQQTRPDPLAALAAARNAVNDPAAAQTLPQSDSDPAQAATGAGRQEQNAAQTAASIREFLREDSAGTESQRGEQAQDGPPPSPDGRADAGRSDPAAAPPDGRHPNEGAASFGRPISDVLSPADIASIGADRAAPSRSAQPALDDGGAQEKPSPEHRAPDRRSGTDELAAAPPSGGAGAGAEAPGNAEASSGGFEDLVELWPELLEEILHQDRDSWNAVRAVTPLALEGDVLTVGLASQSDLAAFKTVGAGPLRETIHAAIGVSVKYVPKRVAPRENRGAQGEGPGGGQQRAPQADAEEPHRASRSEAQTADMNDPVQRAAARLSALGPALAAPAWADPAPADPEDAGEGPAELTSTESASAGAGSARQPLPPEPAPDAGHGEQRSEVSGTPETDDEPREGDPARYDPGAYGDGAYGDADPLDDPFGDGDPYAGADRSADGSADAAGSAEPRPADPASTAPEPANPQSGAPSAAEPADPAQPARPADPEPAEPAPAKRSAPAFTRYGEAVVREVLGARFVEERPLPPR